MNELPKNDFNRGRLEGLREALDIVTSEWKQAKAFSETERMVGISHVHNRLTEEIRRLRNKMGLKP